jgi:hypothetical protein
MKELNYQSDGFYDTIRMSEGQAYIKYQDRKGQNVCGHRKVGGSMRESRTGQVRNQHRKKGGKDKK